MVPSFLNGIIIHLSIHIIIQAAQGAIQVRCGRNLVHDMRRDGRDVAFESRQRRQGSHPQSQTAFTMSHLSTYESRIGETFVNERVLQSLHRQRARECMEQQRAKEQQVQELNRLRGELIGSPRTKRIVQSRRGSTIDSWAASTFCQPHFADVEVVSSVLSRGHGNLVASTSSIYSTCETLHGSIPHTQRGSLSRLGIQPSMAELTRSIDLPPLSVLMKCVAICHFHLCLARLSLSDSLARILCLLHCVSSCPVRRTK